MAATIEELLARLEPELGVAEGPPVRLEGGITNRNYRVQMGGKDYVVRCPSKNTQLLGIDRGSELAATRAAARAGVAPHVAAFVADEGCLVTEYVEAAPLDSPDLRDASVLTEVAETLRSLHAGPPLANAFDTQQVAGAYRATILAKGGAVPDGYDFGQSAVQRVAAALNGPAHTPVPCHNDLLAANFLRGDGRVLFIDWEYAGMGDRFFDLANLAVNNDFGAAEESALLETYFEEPATRQRLAALRCMKLVSDFREGMWGAVQAVLAAPDEEFDCAAYGDKHMRRLLDNAADARFPEWLEDAAG